MLDVNSIHHILSCHKSIEKLMFDLNSLCIDHGIPKDKIQSLYKEYGIADRFDDADTIFVKRMLQHVLPEKVRNSIISNLFKKYVGVSESEISKSIEFLEQVKAPISKWIMCYPYGAYNKTTLSLLKKFDASIGITTEARVASLDQDSPFTLPRLDTNDFPQ